MDSTPHFGFPYIAAAQAQKHITHNEALYMIDNSIQIGVMDRDLATAPETPVENNRFIVGDNATNSWLGHETEIAIYQDQTWIFYQPKKGWLAWVYDEETLCVFNGSAWQKVFAGSEQGASVNPAPLVGVNATADATNRLSVSSPATLLNHEGSGHQLKLNKNAVADTVSLLYQKGFSGRAEMGLTGDDDFHIKVSGDGTTWKEAMVVDASTGIVSFPNSTIGSGGGSSTDNISVIMTAVNKTEAAFKMVGAGSAGPVDNAEGVGLFLTYNAANNRQFALADTQTKKGVRFLAAALDGYNDGARTDLRLGNNTHGVHISYAVPNSQFSISNWTGVATKTVCSIRGATSQTGNLLDVTTAHYNAPVGDGFVVKADGRFEFGNTAKLKSYTVATLPATSTSEAGAMIFVINAAGGSIPAFSDGTNWRRMTDRTIV